MTVEHSSLTGSQLHEPKGVSAATAGTLGFASSNAISWGSFIGTDSVTASSSSTIALTGLGDYLMIRLTFLNLLRATTSTTLRCRLSTDNGSSYISTSIYESGWADNAADDGEDTTSFNLTGDEDTTYLYTNGVFNFYNFNSSLETHYDGMIIKSTSADGGGTNSGAMVFGGIASASAFDAIQFFSSSGNLTSGTVYLEGFKGT